jgi:tripartite-type tricarboxylate transporter receptor subunit TctC
VVGTQVLVKAPADGYTLGWVSSPHAINPALYPSLPYDSVKDFKAIVNFASTPLVFVASPAFSANSIADLIAYAKANPGKVNFASNGNGSSSHLATELLVGATGVKFTHVPYKATGQMITDLIAGQIDFAALGVITTLPLVQTGKLKALAVTGAAFVLLPSVPTVADTVQVTRKAWMGIVAPAAFPTPSSPVDRRIAIVMKDPAVVPR